VVINRSRVPASVLRRYRAQAAEPVNPSFDELDRMRLSYVTGDLLHHRGVVRHDQKRLTRLLLDEFVKRRPAR
jgi:hypothetical protein